MSRLCAIVLWLVMTASVPAFAVQPDEVLPDPALEARARALSQELRCMVCQNQSIDDSDAPLARDLRLLVRERLKAGDSDRQVMDFLTVRYGDFVLLNPPLNWHPVLLWALPVGVLVAGGFALFVAGRRRSNRQQPLQPAALTREEQARVERLLEGRSR